MGEWHPDSTGRRRGRHGALTVLDAAEAILRAEARPMNYREIADRIIREGLWRTRGKTPELTVHVALSIDSRDETGRFSRIQPGVFSLRVPDRAGRRGDFRTAH